MPGDVFRVIMRYPVGRWALFALWSRHAGRSVLSGATTPNRKLLAPPVASLPVIVAVLSIHLESIVRAAVPLLTAEQAPTHRPHARHDPRARPISAHTGGHIAIRMRTRLAHDA